MLVLAFANLAHAESGDLTDELRLLEEEATVEIAAKRPQPLREVPGAVTLISRREIEDAPALSIVDLFRSVPGMDVGVITPFSVSVGVRALATEANNLVLVLIDGREMNQELFGTAFWSMFPISIFDVERIEVIRGPGSALYGANAYSGVVNIVTRPPSSETRVEARGYVGLRADMQDPPAYGAVRGTFGGKKWSAAMSASYEAENLWYEFDRLGMASTRGRGALEVRFRDDMKLTMEGGGALTNGRYFLTIGRTRFRGGEAYARADFDWKRFQAQLYFSHFDVTLVPHADINLEGTELATISDINGIGNTLDLQLQHRATLVPGFDLTYGAHTRFASFDSEQMVGKGVREWRGGAFFQLEWAAVADKLWFTAGTRIDVNSNTPSALSPRASIVASPAPDHYIRGSVGLAFRKPAFAETKLRLNNVTCVHTLCDQYQLPRIFSEGIANPNLENEKVRTYEIGYSAKLFKGRLRASIDLFFNQYRDFIEFDATGFDLAALISGRFDYTSMSFKQIGNDVDAYGGELAIEWIPTRWMRLYGSWGPRRAYKARDGNSYAHEPFNTVTFGFRIRTSWRLKVAANIRFVSQHESLLRDPNSLLKGFSAYRIGNDADLRFRVTYTFKWSDVEMDVGFVGHTPVTTRGTYREFPGAITTNRFENYGGEPIGWQALGLLEFRYGPKSNDAAN
ncbi:MAG: TonB-dependent receptor [Deltaproteobacteria bacterium]|nr:TonB-dependent receptor [Deltaproteobacteria bacterium]